jgi:hypothetical protein
MDSTFNVAELKDKLLDCEKAYRCNGTHLPTLVSYLSHSGRVY